MLKFEKFDKNSQWANHYYYFWLGAWKSFEFNKFMVFSNFDSGQFAYYQADSGDYKINGYLYYEDDPT